jgi:threonine/homoserine/homoserine lactone efflux protein
MIAFSVGLFIGFLMCIPIGPINVWVINTYLKKSSTRALSIAFGGSLMDLCYFYLILSGLSFFTLDPKITMILKSVGIVFIFILGVKEIINKTIEVNKVSEGETPKGILKGILLGILIYTSNPTLILTMAGLGTFVKSLELFKFNQLNIILISIGLSLGSFLWFIFLIKIVERYKETIRNKYLNYLSRVSGVLMIGLSLFMGQRLYF